MAAAQKLRPSQRHWVRRCWVLLTSGPISLVICLVIVILTGLRAGGPWIADG